MRIKVCGLTRYEQMLAVEEGGADYIGIILYERSKRFIGNPSEEDKRAIRKLGVQKVGVFVNTAMEEVEKAIKDYSLSAVQLHGDETPDFCRRLMNDVTVFKAFQIGDNTEIDDIIAPFADACHYYLFDKATASYGGSGAQFNWKKLGESRIGKPFFLSGGIRPEDAGRLRELKHPFLYGIDINSRFEISAGVKDIEVVKTFIDQVRQD